MTETDKAYSDAIRFAKTHYENFPVVSLFIPRKFQKHVAIIYWFARTADDIADEGNLETEERLDRLNEFRKRIPELINGNSQSYFELALGKTISEMKLSAGLFSDLLEAFKQDVIKKSYENFEEVLNYCRKSANPVGRLILELFGIRNEQAFIYSDNICTALQLTNFYQDVSIDYHKGRIYFPLSEMKNFGVEENIFTSNENSSEFKELLKFNVRRAQSLFEDGKKLLNYLSGRLKFEIKWTILDGEAILNKIIKNDYKVLGNRPELKKSDFLILLFKAIFKDV
jgi:squalene synthase HpnC